MGETITCIKGAKLYRNHAFSGGTLAIADGKLRILPENADTAGYRILNADGLKAVPGFLDTHTHGAMGYDVNGASAKDLSEIGRFMACHGTTAWLASILTDTEEQTGWCIRQMRQCQDMAAPGAELLGNHLEGPFLSPAYKGAMPEHLLQCSNLPLVRRYQELAEGNIRYITISPELPGAVDMIPALREMGIVVGIGHSGAVYAEAMAAVKAGASVGTHVGNAMRLLHQHEPAIFGAVLESDIYGEIIADGRHLAPATVRILLKAKGAEHLIAITDSIMAAGLPDGNYHLGVNEVVVEDGDAKLASDGTRAGSTLTQDKALQNLLAFTGRPAEELIPLLTENPAREMGFLNRKGTLDDGKDADIVLLDDEYRVVHVFARGNQIL